MYRHAAESIYRVRVFWYWVMSHHRSYYTGAIDGPFTICDSRRGVCFPSRKVMGGSIFRRFNKVLSIRIEIPPGWGRSLLFRRDIERVPALILYYLNRLLCDAVTRFAAFADGTYHYSSRFIGYSPVPLFSFSLWSPLVLSSLFWCLMPYLSWFPLASGPLSKVATPRLRRILCLPPPFHDTYGW